MVPTDFGHRLKDVRLKAGLSQEAFARKLKVTTATINRYENGRRTPDVEFINRLVTETGCDASWLLTGRPARRDMVRDSNNVRVAPGGRIAWYRISVAGMQPDEFADLMGLTLKELSDIEAGAVAADSEFLSKLYYNFHDRINLDWVLTGRGEPSDLCGHAGNLSVKEPDPPALTRLYKAVKQLYMEGGYEKLSRIQKIIDE